MACVLLLKCVAGKIFAVAVKDISAGAVVFPAGTRLTSAELPVIASLGIAEVPVIRKVRVALFVPVMNSSCPVSHWAMAKSTIPTLSPYT